MKKILMRGVLVAVALLLFSPGISPAGDRTEGSPSPEFGSWEYWMAEETGNLPSPDSGGPPREETMNTSSPEFGTWEYWMAEETGNLPGSEPRRYPSRGDASGKGRTPDSGRDSWEYQIGG